MSVRAIVYFILFLGLGARFDSVARGDGIDFASPVHISTGVASNNDALITDLDGDSDPDFVLQRSGQNGESSTVEVVYNLGDFEVSAPIPIDTQVVTVGRIAVGDVNLDGYPEIIVTEHISDVVGRVVVLINDGAGNFPTHMQLPGDDAPSEGQVGDVTGDGWPDIVFTNFDGGDVWVYESDGSGGFSAPRKTPTMGGPFGPQLADYDGDGDLDLFILHVLQFPSVVFVENIDGVLAKVHCIQAHFNSTQAPTADLNGDGLPEIISWKYQKFRVLENLGNFEFALSNLIDPFGSFDPSVPGVAVGDNVGDFDLDGVPDILGRTCSLPEGDGTGLLLITDIEGPSYGLYPDFADVGTSAGNIDGTDLAGILASWGSPVSVDIADLNDDLIIDGKDLARLLANWGPLPERPPFTPHVIPFELSLGCFLDQVAVDYDNDGDDDIVVRVQDGFLVFENLLLRIESKK